MNQFAGNHPRRVLFVHADAGLYGSGVSLLELASRLPHDRYLPLVAIPTEGPLVEALRARQVEVVVFPFGALRRTFRPDHLAAIAWHHVTGAARLARLIRTHNVALVHTNTTHVLSGAVAARRTHRPHLTHIRENILSPEILARMLAQFVWSSSDHLIAISHATATDFLGPRGTDPKVRVIYNGVDLQAFQSNLSPPEARMALHWPIDEPHIGIMARLAPWKGHQVFLDAAAQVTAAHPSACFAIIGDADTRHNERYKFTLQTRAEQLGLASRLRWTGFVTPVQPLLAALDIVVVPSIRPEPFGRTVIESMAMTRPVVASNHGGPPEILSEGGGILVPPGDAGALARALLSLLHDANARIQMGHAGREQVLRRFDIDAHVAAVIAFYDEIFSQRG